MATEADYVPDDSDLGFYLACEVEPVSAAGWRGKPVSGQAAAPVEAPEGKLLILPTEYATGTELTTNSGAVVTWERDDGGNWVFVRDSESYLLTANDIGLKLRATLKKHVTDPTVPIGIKADLISYLRAVIRAKTLKFVGEMSRGGLTWNVIVDEAGIVLKSKGTPDKMGKWATVKCNAVQGTRDEMLLFLDASAKFMMKPNLSNDARLSKAIGIHTRDFVVAAIDHFSHLTKR
jgi:hypothetical protein